MRSVAGLTLTELVLAALLLLIVVSAVISGYNFILTQTQGGLGRGSLDLQLDYALEKIRLQCQSASSVDGASLFSAGESAVKDSFCLTGERDPYNISASAAKRKYCYKIEDSNLILEESDISGSDKRQEVLLEARYQPSLSFKYDYDKNKPLENVSNFLTLAITATAKNISGQDRIIGKREAIRFWYARITQ